DQRENRSLVRQLAGGARVLNCFCFSGGFSVNAALGGAAHVFSVDQDADAISLARENFRGNGLDPERHDFLAADVFRLLQSFRDEGRQFDLLVLDPPAFAKTQRAVEAALDGYASLNRQALALVAPGGLLATASCSARVSPEAFLGTLKEAAGKAGVDLTLVEERYQPPDHPVALAFPEGRYLKFHILRVQPW
ncbi:MAG: class I SAM-dependent rRNA methyltransferase, partial [Myxococcaceae bacterium]